MAGSTELGVWSASLDALRPAGTGGWIGYWSPGIGDPSIIGWLTVVLYLGAAWGCWWITRSEREGMAAAERLLWRTLAIALAALGVNKQLDLQTALTELGRMLAADEGWYQSRHRVQRIFILGVGTVAAAIGIGLLVVMRRAPLGTRVSLVGFCALLAFVVVRASSFHHVDLFIRSSWWGIKGNWLMEVGGLFVILAGVGLRCRAPGRVQVRTSVRAAHAERSTRGDDPGNA